jgi:O-antigen ligase
MQLPHPQPYSVSREQAPSRALAEPRLDSMSFVVSVAACIYVFVLLSRLSEWLFSKIGSSLYLLAILATFVIGVQLMRGKLLPVLMKSPGHYVVILSCWMVAIVPFSSWPGGSVYFLRDTWSKSLLAFFCISAAAVSFRTLRFLNAAVAWAGIWTLATVLLSGREALDGRYEGGLGSLAQANDLAYHSIYVLPFLFLFTRSSSMWAVCTGGIGILMAGISVLRTGSRAGLIQLVVVVLMIFWRLKGASRGIFALACIVIGLLGLGLANEQALRRIQTLTGGAEEGDQAQLSAEQSTAGRVALLKTAVLMTITHPVVGVGPGTFVSAATLEKSMEHPLWLEAHNAYVKVSSETGFPGLFLWLASYLYTYVRVIRKYRGLREQPEMDLPCNMAYALMISFTTFLINGCFDSNLSYSYYGLSILGLSYGFLSIIDRMQAAPAVAVSPIVAPVAWPPRLQPAGRLDQAWVKRSAPL